MIKFTLLTDISSLVWMHITHDFRQYPAKSRQCLLFLPLLGHCGLQGLGGSYHSHVYSSVRFTHTDVSTAVMFAPPYPLLRKPPKGAARIRFSLSHLLFLYFAPYVQASLSWQMLFPFPGGNPAKLMMLVEVPFIAGKCQTKYLGSAIGWRMRLHIIIYGGGER